MGKLRNLLLFLGSLIFYAWGEPVYVILMLFSSIFNYYMGTELERLYYDDRKQKINLIFSIIINLAVLVFFKYYGFLLNTIGGIIGIHIPHPELSLPIGLSFYTFRNLSYLFDIYLSKVSAQRNFLTFAVYSTMFPYTSAGPIVRYTDIETQLKQRTINISKFGTGAELFVKGLAKKVLLADNLSVLYSSICGHPQMSVFTSWLGILAYTMQLYFDFSGYSDMAIGLGADNFYKSDWVKVEKVSFSNQYKMKVAGNLFLPKTMKEGEKYPAIIVGHPMGAVKEQSANLYATKMAERGFVTLSIDLSF